MTGSCTVPGCHTFISGPVPDDPTLGEQDKDWLEFQAFREVYLLHAMTYHKELVGVVHAHAADYMKTVLAKFAASATDHERLDRARHDVARLFYWVLMGELFPQKVPAPPALILTAPRG